MTATETLARLGQIEGWNTLGSRAHRELAAESGLDYEQLRRDARSEKLREEAGRQDERSNRILQGIKQTMSSPQLSRQPVAARGTQSLLPPRPASNLSRPQPGRREAVPFPKPAPAPTGAIARRVAPQNAQARLAALRSPTNQKLAALLTR